MPGGEGEQKMYSSKSGTFLAFCFCFIIGIGLFTVLDFVWSKIFFIILINIFLLVFFWHRALIRFFLFLTLAITLAAGRVSFLSAGKADNMQSFLISKKIYYTAMVHEEPNVNYDKISLVVSDVAVSGTDKISGKIMLSAPVTSRFIYGDKISFVCALTEPENKYYQKYLLGQKINSVCYFPKDLKKVSEQRDVFYYIFSFKNLINTRLRRLMPEPGASLVAGVLYGAKSGLPEDLSLSFKQVGLSHIVAVSGYNVQIIAAAIFSVGLLLGFNRKKLFWFSLGFIILYVLFTGASASIARAGLMGAVFLLAGYWGRPGAGIRALIFAAAVLLCYNPYYLWYDVGFELSFLAAIGLLFLLPILRQLSTSFAVRLSRTWRILSVFWEIFLTTLCATIITAPLLLYSFGQISLVTLLANILVLWAIPLLMLLGFTTIFLSFVCWPLALITSASATGLANYIIFIAKFFGNLPFATWQIKITLPLLFLCYLILFFFFFGCYKKYEKTFLVNFD